MRFILLITCIAIFSYHPVAAQAVVRDTTWKKGGFASLMFNQSAFSHWAAGGVNSLTLTFNGLGFINYKKDKNIWENYMIANYGFTQTQYVNDIRKNTDYLELQTKYGHDIGHHFYLTGLLNLQTQFGRGYNPTFDTVFSKIMAPGYLLASAGIEWKPVSYFSLYLSPATGKFTFVLDQQIADIVRAGSSLYGTDPAIYGADGILITHGKKSKAQFGALFIAAFSKDIVTNVNLTTKLTLFSPYENNIDVNYDLFINMKINKYLTANFFTNLIYYNAVIIPDYDSNGLPTGKAGPRTQVKEGLGVGLSYKFGDEVKSTDLKK